jgi:acetyl esterase/lipase
MSWELDPEIERAMAPMLAALNSLEPLPVGDVTGRREVMARLASEFPPRVHAVSGVDISHHVAIADDGHPLPLTVYLPQADRSGAVALYIHGGGMMMGSVEDYDQLLRFLAARSGTALVAVEYRLAPEHPHPTPVEDCYAALRWTAEHASELGGDPARLVVAGDSAGGGLAAAVALLARDRKGPPLARQVLIYPMLDDRTVTRPPNAPTIVTWGYSDNATGWNALLGDAAGTSDVSPYAAPARATDLTGLPSAYVMVGGLDIFLSEDIEYAARLAASGVAVELHVHPGAPHSFDDLAFPNEPGRRALEDEIRALRHP